MSKYVQMFQNLSVTDFQFNAVMIRVWLILIICKLLICKFTYLLKFVVTQKNNMYDVFAVINRHVQSGEKFISPSANVPAEVKQGSILLAYFSSHIANKYPFSAYLVPYSFHFLCFLVVISLFKMGKARSGKVLSQSRSGVFKVSLSSPL